ncbi:MAG: HAMP domain-containing protein [Anaerolineales bacterium]|uniref:HAMP domain-containing protein n=1 Tax=Candidatus Villigracilis proximus TaxID=3140683 RepID=UPI003134ED12|nr:HAMP domain-containing protein [Anaerolineales bacterium]
MTDKLGPAEKAELHNQADIYLAAFEQLVQLNNEIEIANETLIASARAVEPLALKLETLGEQLATDDINRAEANNAQTFTISIIIVFIALASSILLSITLSRQITQPVTQLTNTAQQIAEGNFDTYAEVNSADEVGALAKDFNSMTSRLRQAFEDVRRRALAVQTSAEVSQRLSVATNPGQLAVDVVEQVQAAFNYYHAHIYFLDENSGDLIMAGGTGEAGAKMLANKHRVAKGRGLVGRTATNEPVLVPDVSQAEGWLPQRLIT